MSLGMVGVAASNVWSETFHEWRQMRALKIVDLKSTNLEVCAAEKQGK